MVAIDARRMEIDPWHGATAFGLIACLILAAPDSLRGHEGETDAHDVASTIERQPDFLYDPADHTIQAQVWDDPACYDADVMMENDATAWVTWLTYASESGDSLWVGRTPIGAAEDDDRWELRSRMPWSGGQMAAPTLTRDAAGRRWLTYEARTDCQWDVWMCELDADAQCVGVPLRVSPGSGSDIHHRVAVDSNGLWIAWQSDHDGQFDIVVRHWDRREWSAVQVVSFNERGDWHPALAVDAADRVYVAWDGFDGESYQVFSRVLANQAWQPIAQVTESDAFEGRVDLAVRPDGSEVWIAWEEGAARWGRPYRGINTETIRDHAGPLHRHRAIRIAKLESDGSPRRMLESFPMPSRVSASQRADLPDGTCHLGAFYERAKIAFDSASQLWVVYRHTDLSLCRVPLDGTLDDAYRYAIDVAELDFLGITDHSRDLARGDALSQLWWRSRKEVDRHPLCTDGAMQFVPYYAYERSHGNTADHNVISLLPNMLRPHTYPVPEFWRELNRETITIPHQPIRRDTWSYQDDALRPLVEMFQGCRDANIADDIQQGLAKGYQLGFIASSDHMSTSASYAAVWAEEPTRVAIF